MQRSFSLVDDESQEDVDDEQPSLRRHGNVVLSERRSAQKIGKFEKKMSQMTIGQEESPDEGPLHLSKMPSAGPSGRQSMLRPGKTRLSSDSDLDDSDVEEDKTKIIVGEYDPKLYENLDVNPEAKEVFQYITKYIPQQMSLDHKFKPFVPEFLPAVGDIDAFLKVIAPSGSIHGEHVTPDQKLGLVVLDEPAANQSDSALLHLQLRAESANTVHDSNVVVKKLDNVEKNVKVIDKWIKDISALHKSKSFPAVRYTEVMPDLDELMQEWPEDVENELKEKKFPEPNGSLEEYVEEVCGIFQIPTKNKMQALHLFFSLYAAVKSSQLFKKAQLEKGGASQRSVVVEGADHLLLE